MAMTEEERRRARNEASRRWYAAHKAAKAAVNKARPAAKKAEAKPAKAKKEKPEKKAKKSPAEAIQKAIDKVIRPAVKIAPTLVRIIKGVAPLLGDVYKAGDVKLVKKVLAQLKGLGFLVMAAPDGRATVSWSAAKAFRVPKTEDPAGPEPVEAPVEAPADAEPIEAPVEAPADAEPVEVPVDPAKLEGVEAGSEGPVNIEDPFGEEDEDEDGEEDEEDEDEDGEEDEEDEEESDLDGRADMMREIEAQGGYDD